jgi:protoheme IX farnesyltransferase
MLPVVSGPTVTRQQIALYTLPMAAAAVAPGRSDWPERCMESPPPRLVPFRRHGAPGARQPGDRTQGMKPEKRLFTFSILYLFVLFGALVADRWLLA